MNKEGPGGYIFPSAAILCIYLLVWSPQSAQQSCKSIEKVQIFAHFNITLHGKYNLLFSFYLTIKYPAFCKAITSACNNYLASFLPKIF